MSSRFIVFSDLHLNSWTYGSKMLGSYGSRLIHQVYAIERMADYAEANGINNVFFCGDFFHTSRVSAELSMAAYKALDCLRERVDNLTFVVGNHDQNDRQGEMHALSFLSRFGLVADGKLCYGGMGHLVSALAYTEDASKLKSFLDNAEKGEILLMHQGVSDIEINTKGFTLNEMLKPDMIPEGVHAFCGHYHSHKVVNDRLVIPGSFTQLTWADVGDDRGWLDVTISDSGEKTIKHIDSGAPRFERVDYGSTSSPELNDAAREWLSGNFVRVVNYKGDEGALREYMESIGVESLEIAADTGDLHSVIDTEQFSSFDEMFNTFVEKKGLDERSIEIGQQIMSSKYATPEF